MGVGGIRHAPAALPLGKTRYPLYRRLGGRQGRSGHVQKISPPPGFDPRTVQPIARRYTDYAIPAHDIQQDQNSNFNRRAEHPVSCMLYQPCPWNNCSKNKCGISVRLRQNVHEDGRGVGLLHNFLYSTANGFLWRYSRLFKNWNNLLSLPHRISTKSVGG